ncbi:MAG TPA: ABC transporter permease [Candidatus Krumholzibacteria bacterium]|nr:ABC transporter permease [Candidatus Krumholzibacteria bacterium]
MEALPLAGLLVAATLRIAVPYVFAALGGFYSERSGVINIALEGMLLTGAFACVVAAHAAESAGLGGAVAGWLGVGAACVAGGGLGALHALICVRFGANQIVSGLGLNLLAMGATKFLLTLVFGSSANSERIAGIPSWDLPGLASWSVTRVLFCTPLVLLAVLAVVVSQLLFRRTVFGLRLHATGEHPEAALSLGVPVVRLRWTGVVLSGALAALGGAWLALEQHQFTAGMSSGRGFIALAALIFGKWTPRGAALACLLFAAAEAVQIQLQGGALGIPTQFLQMLPYVVTMVALAGVIGRSRPPAALGRPLEPLR